jgi:Ca-activated chloride channel homolog
MNCGVEKFLFFSPSFHTGFIEKSNFGGILSTVGRCGRHERNAMSRKPTKGGYMKMSTRIGVRVAAILTVCGIWSAIFAAASEESLDKTLSPYFVIQNGDPATDRLPLKQTSVDVKVAGVIADVTVHQLYTNEGAKPINARYVFPASTRAAVYGMQMTVGNHRVVAKIKEREAAKKEYEEAKSQGKSASLLEQERPNVFSMSLANIMPNDLVDIELRYTELLVPENNLYEFVYPTVVGPRYSNQPESSAPESDKWVKSPYTKQGVAPTTKLLIAAHLATGMPLQEIICPSHKTSVKWNAPSQADIVLDSAESNGGNRDFVLRYRLSGEKISSGLLLYKGKDENFFLVMMQPPRRITPATIPGREYLFVVDVSGSMNGYPLDVSKELLKKLIGGLRPSDLFNVVLFAGQSATMSPRSVSATAENIQSAITLLSQQQGGGGTELLPALQQAVSIPEHAGYSRNILIITDGFISAERDVFTFIRNNLSRSNVFSFGIGTSVNRYLMEGIAKAGMGEPFIVSNEREAPAVTERFNRYVSAPLLTDVKVEYKGFKAYDVQPSAIPDLFAERPLVIFGKYHGSASGVIIVSGTTGGGRFEQSFDAGSVLANDNNSALRYLWARSRIAELSDYRFTSEEDGKKEVLSLGLTYNLLTKYTSFIAVHEIVRNTTGPAKDVDQPLPLPQGVSDLAVGGGEKSVPEPELWMLCVVILLITAIARLRRNNRQQPVVAD